MSSRSSTPGANGSRRGSVVDASGAAQQKKFLNGWTKEQERLMADWADIAGCYRWLHDRAEKIFSRSNMFITIPVIILSTLTGTANFAVDSFVPSGEDSLKKYVAAGIGGISIFAGILTTLGNFFQYAQKSEAHKVAGVAWGKFQRQVAVELSIHPDERIEAMDFLKICRQDLDRLIEQSPAIPDAVIGAFESEFKHVPNLKVPDICHGIEHTRVYDLTNTRLGKITADAALHLKYRKQVLKDTILPDIDKKIQDELNTRIEQRIKALLPPPAPPVEPPSPPPEEVSDGAASTQPLVNLETDWRQLLVGRKHVMIPIPHAAAAAAESPLPNRPTPQKAVIARAESVIIDVVGSGEGMPPTLGGSFASDTSGAFVPVATAPQPPLLVPPPPPSPPSTEVSFD